jgi:hypothetical protein
MPSLVRVPSATTQLSQFLKRSYLPSRPFFTLQWALGSSQVWLQPLDSFTPTHIVARQRQVPHLELPPRSRASRSQPIRSAFLAISDEVRHNPYGSPSGHGPGLTRGKTPHTGLVLGATLCSFYAATAASAWPLFCSAFLALARPLNRVLTQFRCAHRHLYLQVLAFLAQGAFRLARPHSFS